MNTTTRIIDARGTEEKRLLVLPQSLRAGTQGWLNRNNIQNSVLAMTIHENYIQVRYFRIFKVAKREYMTKIYNAYYHMS